MRFAALAAALCACSAESASGPPDGSSTDGGADAAPVGPCAPIPWRCTPSPNYSTWFNSTVPYHDGGVDEYVCGFHPLMCRYFEQEGATTITHLTVRCGTSLYGLSPEVRMEMRFRAPFIDLPVGRTLRLGQDFEITRFSISDWDVSQRMERPHQLYTGALPVLGALTLTVTGAPKNASAGRPATLPRVRFRGQICGAPLNFYVDAENVELN